MTFLLGLAAQPLAAVQGLLPQNKTPYENALDLAGGGRIDSLPAEIIETTDSPYSIPLPLLSWLAWGLRVNIWSEGWTEAFQRWVVASEVQRHRIKGSLAGIDAYLHLVDAEIVGSIRPPATTFLGDVFSSEERAQYLAQFAQVRIYPFFAREPGYASYLSQPYFAARPTDFLGGGPDDAHVTPTFFMMPEQAQDPYTIDVRYWDRGVETQMIVNSVVADDDINQAKKAYYELVIPPSVSLELFLNDGGDDDSNKTYLDDSNYLGDKLGEKLIFRIAQDVVQNPSAEIPNQRTISGGTGLINNYPEMVFQQDVSKWGELYLDVDFLQDDTYLQPDMAWSHIYEVWYVFDEKRVPVAQDQFTYLNWTYLGMPPYNAELQVSAQGHGSESEIFLDVDYLPAPNDITIGFITDPQEVAQRIDDMCMATRVGMSVRDKILINTTTRRPPRPSDLVKVGAQKVGDWIVSEP